MPSSHFFVIADNRADKTTLPEITENLEGIHILYDANIDKFLKSDLMVTPNRDRVFNVAIWDRPSVEPDPIPSWEIDPSVPNSNTPYIDSDYHDDVWYDVHNVTVKRNRAMIQLFNCLDLLKLIDDQRVGYNTMVRLSQISDNPIYKTSPIIYTLTEEGEAEFYFAPAKESGWFRCYLLDDFEKMEVKNPKWDSRKTSALSPCDQDGWRIVLNAEYNGVEFDFYPNKCSNYWDKMEGLGEGIKIRALDEGGNPLPYSKWLKSGNKIVSGVGNYSSFGVTGNVFKVEARYI